MKFQSGILGVIIVVIALMGTVFGGYFLNVNGQSTVTTDYSSVTDVSSLYTYTEQPDFIEYNPAKNFTGYKLSNNSGSGISFTHSSTANQYYMGQYTNTVETLNITSLVTETDFGIAPTSYGRVPYSYDYGTNTAYSLYDYENYDYNALPPVLTPKETSFTDLITTLKSRAPANTSTIAINIPSNSDLNYHFGTTLAGGTMSLNPSSAHTPNIYTTVDYGILNGYRTGSGSIANSYTYFRNYEISFNFDNTQNVNDTLVNINFADQYSSQQSPSIISLMASTSKQVTVSNYTSSSRSGTLGDYPYWNGGNYIIEVVYYHDLVYEYMNPSQGVTINNASNLVTTDWTNDKTNHQMSIVFGVNGGTNSNTVILPTNDTISLEYTGSTNRVRVNSGSWTDIGDWEHFLLTIDGYDGKVSVTPIITFVNYQTFTLANYTYNTIGDITVSPFTKLKWSQTDDSYTFSVYSTMVEVTNKLFMVDPSLNIKNYFPLTEGFKIEMKNFTKLGTSFTINNQTFYGDVDGNPIEDTGYIYIPNGDVSIKLGTMSIIEDEIDGHTYVQSNEFGSSRVDLGVTTSSVISATGTWFFTNQLYEGNIVDSFEYVWDWANNLTSTQSILIWLGFIVIGSVVAHRFFKFTMLDLAIVVASSVILYCIMGVF